MSVPRFYVPAPLPLGQDIQIEGPAAHHIGRVLRMRVGEKVILFNGEGGTVSGPIVAVDKRCVTVLAETGVQDDRESPLHTTLGLVLSKGDRFDWALQKATELGVSAIQPLTSQRCDVRLPAERLARKQAHWMQVVTSACEQCGRNRLPDVRPLLDLTTWIAQPGSERRLVLAPGTPAPLEAENRPASLDVLIGPEGGLTQDEIAQAGQYGFETVTFGPRIWRTETAPVASLAIFQWLWGDLAPEKGDLT
ncbi:MAG: 16S rRNA (uracil(1498)-N(3))-methyltransferase [Gammaproteobacteria bacterium]|nr:MAG: 16S rRNA (uracil(1498)-N(3))-methyltransferase [Gammaproteobacteria bacterium]